MYFSGSGKGSVQSKSSSKSDKSIRIGSLRGFLKSLAGGEGDGSLRGRFCELERDGVLS